MRLKTILRCQNFQQNQGFQIILLQTVTKIIQNSSAANILSRRSYPCPDFFHAECQHDVFRPRWLIPEYLNSVHTKYWTHLNTLLVTHS